MRICKLCCKEIEQMGIWKIKEGKVEDYCYRCGVWLLNGEQPGEDDEKTSQRLKELGALMDERTDNLEYLHKWVLEGLKNGLVRKEFDK